MEKGKPSNSDMAKLGMKNKACAPIHLPTKESLELKRLLEWSNEFALVWLTDQVPVQPAEVRDSRIIERKAVEEWEKIGTVKVDGKKL